VSLSGSVAEAVTASPVSVSNAAKSGECEAKVGSSSSLTVMVR